MAVPTWHQRAPMGDPMEHFLGECAGSNEGVTNTPRTRSPSSRRTAVVSPPSRNAPGCKHSSCKAVVLRDWAGCLLCRAMHACAVGNMSSTSVFPKPILSFVVSCPLGCEENQLRKLLSKIAHTPGCSEGRERYVYLRGVSSIPCVVRCLAYLVREAELDGLLTQPDLSGAHRLYIHRRPVPGAQRRRSKKRRRRRVAAGEINPARTRNFCFAQQRKRRLEKLRRASPTTFLPRI